jgi:hypothetical protein
MRISSATIDCYLSISATGYSDFQHHHWEVMPSGQIGPQTTNNIPTYTWTVNDVGSDSSGSWSTPMGQSVTVTNGAQALIAMPNTVSLKQTTGFGAHTIQATGNSATKHDVSEMIWVTPALPGKDLITWNASAGTPSMITYQDMGHPIYQLQYGPPYVVPRSNRELVLVANIILTPSVVGGRDWTSGLATFFQAPSPTATAWWVWTVNLVT